MSLAVARAAIVALLLVAWELVVRGGLFSERLLPPPTAVLDAVERIFLESDMGWHTLVTLAEAAVAMAIAVPLGIGLGIFLAENRTVGRALVPFVYFVFSIPKSIFLPVFILSFGIGFLQKTMFGVFSAIFILAMIVEAATSGVSRDLVRVGRAYGATPMQIYRKIYVPAVLPSLVEALRLALIFDITGVIFAEMYAAREGIGYVVAFWGEYFMLPELLAGIAVAASISIVVNELLRTVELRVARWRES